MRVLELIGTYGDDDDDEYVVGRLWLDKGQLLLSSPDPAVRTDLRELVRQIKKAGGVLQIYCADSGTRVVRLVPIGKRGFLPALRGMTALWDADTFGDFQIDYVSLRIVQRSDPRRY